MAQPVSPHFDADARSDPHLAEYEAARDLLQGGDWHLGLEEIERLAQAGSIMSILLVADAMRAGWMYDQDFPGAEAWYRVAVESGSVRGLVGLGLTHLSTDRFGEAVQELEAAIVRDYPPAYNALAGIYFRGDGVPVDRMRALDLWRKGAALGHIPAKRNMVHQCLHGRYGFWARVKAVLRVLPVAIEIVTFREKHPYSDRMR